MKFILIKLDKPRRLWFVAQTDVIAIYPNLKTTEAAQLCYEAILETDIDFDGVDYQEIAIYI